MSHRDFSFVTDTATLCIFDTDCLRHRIDSDADWWCYPPEVQLSELAKGNVAFIDLGADGKYFGVVQTTPLEKMHIQFRLSTPSGHLFIGAGEEATSEGLEPDCTRGGLFVSVAGPFSTVQVARGKEGVIQLAVLPDSGSVENTFSSPLRLK